MKMTNRAGVQLLQVLWSPHLKPSGARAARLHRSKPWSAMPQLFQRQLRHLRVMCRERELPPPLFGKRRGKTKNLSITRSCFLPSASGEAPFLEYSPFCTFRSTNIVLFHVFFAPLSWLCDFAVRLSCKLRRFKN